MTKHPATSAHMPHAATMLQRIRQWDGWNRRFAIDCLVDALLCGIWSLFGAGFMDAQYAFVRVPDRWMPLWNQTWSVALTLPYILHRIRPTIAVFGAGFMDAQYAFVRVPDRWMPLWNQTWSVALTLPYILHRIRPTIAVRWFLVTVVAQLIVGPGMLMADFMAAVMLYGGSS